MAYGFDYFVGALQCPHCGSVSEEDTSTNMQTAVRREPALEALGVGHPLMIWTDDFEDRGYYKSSTASPDGSTRFLDIWECATCGTPNNWAEIVVEDGVIQQVQAVTFNRETFGRAHFISHESISEAARLSGASFKDLVGRDIVEIIRKHL